MVLIRQDDEKKLLFWLIYHVLSKFNKFECFLFYILWREFQGDIRPLALYIEIISLLSKVLKLSSKLTSRVYEARVQWRNLSLTGSSFDCWYGDFCHVKFESLRLEFHRRIWRRRRRRSEEEEEDLKNLKKKEPIVWRIWRRQKNPQFEEFEEKRTTGRRSH